ncbi:MAG: thiamine pyrophosphate-dependent enzyme, partial [Thermoanaerobaculia bacterium]
MSEQTSGTDGAGTDGSGSWSEKLKQRFAAFVAERHPFALAVARDALAAVLEQIEGGTSGRPDDIEALRPKLRQELERRGGRHGLPEDLETTPGISAAQRLEDAAAELAGATDGFLRREAIAASLTVDERRELLGGMILTRATDNRLKSLFLSSEVRWGNIAFQGKGYRSTGQEAIYAACIRLRRGERYRGDDGRWQGDVVAPLIRDLGAALAMNPEPEGVRQVLNAQMGKAGPPMEGRDFHIGDLSRGILPPAAPLSIAPLTVAGVAFAMALEGRETGDSRVAVTFIGEGGSSLGEWHEAINVCASARLPAVFCVENNQTALSTPVAQQTAARVFADKAAGYGIPGLTVDGTDPEAIAAAFTWAVERAREGLGPALIELVCMRMCGHAHHDDMLFLGREPKLSWEYPELTDGGYADREAYEYWAQRDPLLRYAERLERDGLIGAEDLPAWQSEAEELVESEAKTVIAAPWPDAAKVGHGVYTGQPPVRRVEVLENRAAVDLAAALPELDPGRPFDAAGSTFLEGVTLGVADALRGDPRVFVYGQDVGGDYGNAFLLLRPLLEEFGDRIFNSPLTEGGTLGVCIGAA